MIKVATYFIVDSKEVHTFLQCMQLDMVDNVHGKFIGWEILPLSKDEIQNEKAVPWQEKREDGSELVEVLG